MAKTSVGVGWRHYPVWPIVRPKRDEMNRDSFTLFLDTNCLLHYPPMSQIDWKAVSGAKLVKLVLCLQVIHELDQKKSDPRLGDRAKRAIREIRAFRGSFIRDGVTLVVFNCAIRQQEFPSSMSPDSKDDRIVHLVKKYMDANPNETVGLVTEDFGMELRCEAQGLTALSIDATLRLQDPHDQLRKQYQKAVGELELLKTRLPDLTIVAVSPGLRPDEQVRYEAVVTGGCLHLDADEEVEKERQKHPAMGPTMAHVMGGFEQPTAAILISKDDIDAYNERLEQYFEKLRDYLEQRNRWLNESALAIHFDLWLHNVGNGPADDVDVVVTLPDRFDLVAQVGQLGPAHLREPTPPRLPDRPKTSIGKLVQTTAAAAQSFAQNIAPPIWPSIGTSFGVNTIVTPVDSLPIVRIHSYEGHFVVETELHRLKHFHMIRLGEFVARFNTWDDAGPFEAVVRITAANDPEITERRVVFHIRTAIVEG